MGGFWQRIAELQREGRRAVVVTIVAAQGPVPREPGARMVVFPDGTTEGTIGGGALEKRAIEVAAELFRSGGSTRLETYELEDLGMICGGRATVFYELLAPPVTLHIFGAGHVGERLYALAKAAALPLQVRIYDSREEARNRVPEVEVLTSYEEIPDLKGSDYVFICTHSHEEDYRVLKAVLSRGDPPVYVGLVGSRPKWERMRGRLAAEGVPEEAIARVACPVGLPLGGKDPGSIAVSALAEILAHRSGRLGEVRERLGH